MSTWPRVPISELCESIIDCVNKTAPTVPGPTPYRMIRTTNVKNGRVDLREVKYVTEATFEPWVRRGHPEIGDIILTREAPLGEVGMLREADGVFLGQRLVMYRADEVCVDRNFLLAAMRGPDVQNQIRALGSGATVEHMRVPDCGELRIATPPLEYQRRIGAVMSAFDELIALNDRRIELLEDLAHSLYREWFVRYRFPGWEASPVTTSALGSIPAGWGVGQLSEFVATQYGFTASASKEAIGPKFLRGMDVNKRSFTDWSAVPYCYTTEVERERFSVNVGDVFVVRMADPGKVGIVERPVNAVFASYLVRLRSTDARLQPQHLAHMLRDGPYQAWVTGSSTGTTRKSVSAAVMTEPLVAVPPLAVANRFQQECGTLRGALTALVEQNASLVRTRDLLLPRLVTGRLELSDVDLGDLLPSDPDQ